MFTIFKMFMKPLTDAVSSVSFASQSAASTQNMQNIATMFNAFNKTAQTMIHMNNEYAATTARLSDDIGLMADRIGQMADKIVATEVLQSNNFLAIQNVGMPVGVITHSTVLSTMMSDVISTVQFPVINVDNTSINADFIASLFPSATGSNAAIMASMIVSFNDTMQSMIGAGITDVNTMFKLGNDVGKMTVRVGQMADKIVDTMGLMSAVAQASINHTTVTAPTSTSSTATTTTIDPTAPHIESSLTTAAQNVATTIVDLTTSFSSVMSSVATATVSNNNSVHGIVEMFDAANHIIRELITLNTQFLTTVLNMSDEIGHMADRIGDMADQIVEIQKDFSPLYLASHDTTGNVDATQATLEATNGSLHVATNSVNIFLDSIVAVSGTTSMAMPVNMETIGDMTVSFISMLKGFATMDMGQLNMDEITAMFVTANETVQMMMGMNDQYMSAILRLSDDIGLMADRISVMADRIVETQEIQSENFLATYHDALNIVLIGNADMNTLNGTAGNDKLDGKAGADTMIGGTGNDTYYVDNVGDVVIETSTVATEIDTVDSSISYTLGNNVENLTLIGSGAINGTGNSLSNVIIGNDSANILSGGAGNDVLDGKAGADTMIGGTGNDTYYVDNAGDVVTETSTSSSEIDTVNSSIGYTLGSNVENLNLTGIAAINGTGNALANVINGNANANVLSGGAGNDVIDGKAGNDIIYGGTGNDTLTGGTGNDIFVFNTAMNTFTNKDTITDFTSGSDTIVLDHAIFTKLAPGALNADNFVSNWLGAMGDFNDYLTYNTTTGVLSYDADGIGIFSGSVQIAVLGTSSHPTLAASDVVII
jgi:Ca2+-binding RTX toxin-like protein